FELCEGGRVRHTWPRDSFALLACAFSPRLCVVAESGVPAKAIELTSGKLAWSYHSREGAHLIQIDFCPRLGCFVALEYAYTENGRATGPWSPFYTSTLPVASFCADLCASGPRRCSAWMRIS